MHRVCLAQQFVESSVKHAAQVQAKHSVLENARCDAVHCQDLHTKRVDTLCIACFMVEVLEI